VHLSSPLLRRQLVELAVAILEGVLASNRKLELLRLVLELHPLELCAPDHALRVKVEHLRDHECHLNQLFVNELAVQADELIQQLFVCDQELHRVLEPREIGT